MKIEQLKYLIEIGHSRSISSAAGKLYLSHTTLSSILKGAEKELGFPLFQRIQGGVKVTAEGEEALALMEKMSRCFEDIQKLSTVNALLTQPVSIVISPSIHSALAVPINQLFWEQESRGRLEFQIVKGMDVGSCLIKNSGNLGLTYFTEESQENYRMIASRYQIRTDCLYTDHFYLLVRRDHPLAARKQISQEELQNIDLAMLEHYVASETCPVYLKTLGPDNRYTIFSNIALIRRSILSQNMAAILPGLAIGSAPGDDHHLFKAIPLIETEQNPNTMYLCLLHRGTASLRDQEKTALNCIRNYFKDLKNLPVLSILPAP